ncbi:tRNA adenosine(34) deaminase TadA [Phycisphaerales bacterium AB-hyl4]|uniref:tRNA-specific adenosine deaminase n=1 Tax=Natronomicrosphaera hydrolytica TaxID=3242702 RepID=A0ABV4U279_9BACT
MKTAIAIALAGSFQQPGPAVTLARTVVDLIPANPDHDEAMMRLALTEADRAAAMGEVPVGAVIVQGDVVLARAHNRRESDADPTAHAELLAMRAAAQQLGTWRMDECTLYVTLEPCPMCAGALVNARMGRLVYGCTDPKMGCVDTLYHLCTDTRFNHRLMVRGGLLAEDCAAMLQRFFQARRGREKPPKPRPGGLG